MDHERYFPDYHFPLHLVIKLFISLIKSDQRSIKEDAIYAIQGINPPVCIIGFENIPVTGPALITINHYAREGFFIVWAALAVAANIGDDQFWLMTSEWTKRTGGLDQLKTKLTHWLFKHISRLYGFITIPPMPPVPIDMPDRVVSIRNVFRRIEENPHTIMCIAPEGRDFPTGSLGIPSPGTGKFMYQLVQRLHTVIPVGVYENNGFLTLNFGQPYRKEDLINTTDDYVSQFIMKRINRQLQDQTGKYFGEV